MKTLIAFSMLFVLMFFLADAPRIFLQKNFAKKIQIVLAVFIKILAIAFMGIKIM